MPRCTACNRETRLLEAGVPFCAECSLSRDARANLNKSQPIAQQIRDILLKRVKEANARSAAAAKIFTAVIHDVPSGYPHPDGIQRIRSVSRELDSARNEVREAHRRLHEFMSRGIVPDDLKASGE